MSCVTPSCGFAVANYVTDSRIVAVDLASDPLSFECVLDAGKLSLQDDPQPHEHHHRSGRALTLFQACHDGSFIDDDLPNSCPSFNAPALSGQAPFWFPAGLQAGLTVSRFDGPGDNDGRGEYNSFNLQYYSEAVNIGHAEVSNGAFQRTSASGNPSEDGQPVGDMARQTISMPNQRAQSSLPRRRSRYVLQRSGNSTTPILIPESQSTARSWSAYPLDPMQRWRDSPPEDEPTSMSAIYSALKDSSLDFSG